MAQFEIKKTCPRCEGDGSLDINVYDSSGNVVSSTPEDPCSMCEGNTVILWGVLECDEINDILSKCNDIWEKLNE